MATRSTISIKEGDKFKTIYCHWDGYPSNNGKILLEHYQDEEKVKKLISLGDISSLAPLVEPNGETVHKKKDWENGGYLEFPGKPHNFETPHHGVVVAYGRDRGEDNIKAREYTKATGIKEGEEYDYLFADGVWKLRRGGKWIKLTENMCLG
jgi:hypothetical protein